jgi:hypothetical protein
MGTGSRYSREEKLLTTPLKQLLLQKDASLLAVRGGGIFNPYGSFGCIGNEVGSKSIELCGSVE